MTETEFVAKARSLSEAAVANHLFPGGVVGYFHGEDRAILPVGRYTYDAASPAVVEDTMYDIASITKSIPTSCLLLQAVEAGTVSLDDLVITYVPELTNEYRELITIRHLLTYTVIFKQPHGLSGVVAMYGRDFLPYALQSPLTDPPGERYFYTNQPALIMGLLVERLYNKPLADQAELALFEPLGMSDTMFNPSDRLLDRIPPSEIVDGITIQGIVHDETARMMRELGKQTGIAGVFSTAPDLLSFAQMLANDGNLHDRTFLSANMIKTMASNQLESINEHTGLGWEINRPDVMGKAVRDHVLIKSGHTGCLVMVDLEHNAGLVLLSNRMYPQRGDRTALRKYWCDMNEAFLSYLADETRND